MASSRSAILTVTYFCVAAEQSLNGHFILGIAPSVDSVVSGAIADTKNAGRRNSQLLRSELQEQNAMASAGNLVAVSEAPSKFHSTPDPNRSAKAIITCQGCLDSGSDYCISTNQCTTHAVEGGCKGPGDHITSDGTLAGRGHPTQCLLSLVIAKEEDLSNSNDDDNTAPYYKFVFFGVALFAVFAAVWFTTAKSPPTAEGIGAPPPIASLIFKTEFDEWWKANRDKLRTRITHRDYIEGEDDEKMADSMVSFIDKGLAAVRWHAVDSARARMVTTQEEYRQVYTAKLGGRTDISPDNLFNIKLRAEKAIEDGIATAEGNPELQNLLKTLYKHKEALMWSQGNFGPVVYTAEFLGTYANAMVSDSLWQQSEKSFAPSYFSGPRALECGIFYIAPGVKYPLHYHQELESFYILSGKTQFVWLVDDKLVTMDRKQGEWHFNYPNIPHAITTPYQHAHLSIWFREGGPGQAANNKFGPKFIGCAESLPMIDELNEVPDVAASEGDHVGSYSFNSTVFKKDTDKFLRALSPEQFKYFQDDPMSMDEIDNLLTPGKMNIRNSSFN